MRRALLILVPVLASLIACSSPTWQEAYTGSTMPPPPDPIVIAGVVADAYDHRPLEGALIALTRGDMVLTSTSDANGYYAFSNDITPGAYELQCRLDGYVRAAAAGRVPSPDELKGDIDDPPAGVIPYSARHDFYLVRVR